MLLVTKIVVVVVLVGAGGEIVGDINFNGSISNWPSEG
jgi:hypothetical protein